MNSGPSLLWNLVADIPVFIALLICMVFVVMRWKSSPKAALLALIGLVLLLLHTPIFEMIYAFVPEMIVRSGSSATSSSNTYFLIGLIKFSAMALAFGFLLAAVFVRREPARQTAS